MRDYCHHHVYIGDIDFAIDDPNIGIFKVLEVGSEVLGGVPRFCIAIVLVALLLCNSQFQADVFAEMLHDGMRVPSCEVNILLA